MLHLEALYVLTERRLKSKSYEVKWVLPAVWLDPVNLHIVRFDNRKTMGYASDAIEILHAKGLRLTSTRKAVLKLLEQTPDPISAPALYRQIVRDSKGKAIDRVSVHRILKKLEEMGLVHRVSNKGFYIACLHQRCASTYHILANCHQCNNVQELGLPEHLAAPLYKHIQAQHQFAAKKHLLQIVGTCNKCQPASKPPKRRYNDGAKEQKED